MKKISLMFARVVAASWLAISANQAVAGGSERIRRLQAEAKMAELNAQAAARSQAAYEEVWRKSKSTAKAAAWAVSTLSRSPVGALVCFRTQIGR